MAATSKLSAATIISLLESLATVAAVLVALFTQVYLVRARRPSLTMTISNDAAMEDVVVIRSPDGNTVELWIRLRVEAKSKRRTAREAQVRLVKVKRPARDASCQIVPSGPMTWSSTGPQPQSILSGMWLRVDVLRYRVRSPGYADHQLEVEVGYEFSPKDRQSVLNEEGEYEIVMLLGADDGDTTTWAFIFNHHPNLEAQTDDELRRLIRNIRLLRLR
jgi:hypothetical protein